MLITTNMGIQVDPIGINNVNYIRYVRPNVSSIQRTRTRRCLFGRSDPDQNRRFYENAANSERNRCIERYGFDPMSGGPVEINREEEINTVDNNETVNINIDKNVQQSLDNVVVKQSDECVRDREKNENLSSSECVQDNASSSLKDVINRKLPVMDDVQGSKAQPTKRPHESDRKKTVSDYYPKKKKPSS